MKIHEQMVLSHARPNVFPQNPIYSCASNTDLSLKGENSLQQPFNQNISTTLE